MSLVRGAVNLINYKKGDGLAETIVFIMLVGGLIYFIGAGINVPSYYETIITTIISFMYGRQVKQAEIQSKNKNGGQ